MSAAASTITAVILGASGYTGAELIRWLLPHPNVHIKALTGQSQAGKAIGEVYPHLAHAGLPDLVTHEQLDYDGVDVVFCGLPHGTTQPIIASLPEHVKIVDLSADFRLQDAAAYEAWYGHPHQAMALQKTAVYGITELAREAIQHARLVANPGCYPTCSLLPLVPLVKAGLIDAHSISINALSGISGAGRSVKQDLLFCELAEGVSAYGLGHHRHMAEMEQTLTQAAGAPVTISFTPHLMPMKRGMLATTRVQLKPGSTLETLHQALNSLYQTEPFVQTLPLGAKPPSTHAVSGTNQCHISLHADRVKGYALIVSVIDNLAKGASSQAVQNMNLMFGLKETTGLNATAIAP